MLFSSLVVVGSVGWLVFRGMRPRSLNNETMGIGLPGKQPVFIIGLEIASSEVPLAAIPCIFYFSTAGTIWSV